MARSRKSAGRVTVWLRGGTYYLPQTLVFTPEDSGTKKTPVTYAAFPGEGGHQRRNPASVDVDSLSRWHPDGVGPRRPAQRPIFCERQAPDPGALPQTDIGHPQLGYFALGQAGTRW